MNQIITVSNQNNLYYRRFLVSCHFWHLFYYALYDSIRGHTQHTNTIYVDNDDGDEDDTIIIVCDIATTECGWVGLL